MNCRMIRQLLPALLPAVFCLWGAPAAQAAPPFEKGDCIAIIGSGLADRMQYDGWTETLLQKALPKHQLVFRNLAFPGDTVTKRPRSKGFMSPEDYLKHVEADVIWVMFGYNESFAGEAGLSGFKDDLGKMIDNYRNLKPNGKSEPRIVLFSPIAHEDLGTPNLPDGKANNQRLAAYTNAIKEVAAARQAAYVDLFGPTGNIFRTANIPLTINGVHLNPDGNREVAQVIARALLGKQVPATPSLEKLRAAVTDKNWHWFNRYRATDGNDVWGGRSGLKFVDDQTNREVLQHELVMIDVMTANRDKKIWARAQGRDLTVDDSNVPPPIAVESNVGGKSKSSSAQKEGSLDYVSGEDGIAKMKVKEGFEVNLFADEKMFPEVANPVQTAVDPKGRLWVAAWHTYPKWEPMKEMSDRLVILPDENRDGVADKAITFAKVHNPTAFEFWNGGVLVASQPNILFLKDTDGDDRADVRIVMLGGIGSADTHHAANAFVYGPDGGIYWQSGIFLHNNIEHPWGQSLSTGSSGMFRFDPRRYTVSFHAGNSPNPHGISFDYWGYHFATDGTGGRAYQVRPHQKGFKMFELLKKQVRPVPANGVVSSAHFPDDMQQNFLILNTIGFLGIKEYNLARNADDGTVWGEPANDHFIVSEDKNFRPTDMEFGADGALYFADWHNVIIGHMQHNVRDPNRDHQHGRIYRVTATGRPLQEDVPIAGESLGQLMKNLEHPIDGIRYRTRIELSGRDTGKVIAACQEWMKQWDPDKKEHAHHLLEALWLHQQHNVRNGKLLAALLKSPEPHARVAAATVQHHWFNVDPTGGAGTVVETGIAEATGVSGVLSDGPDLTEVRIGTLVEQLKYDIKEFEVKAGKKVKLTFLNPDYVPHNIVITQPKAANEIAEAALKLGAKGFDLQFIPESDKIIAASKLLDHKQEEIMEFTAPEQPGDYEFVCT
ncbi:MAG: hypothetical protein HKO57_09640, partial [Akkermansiaceae bacterium]|nr:hypothetical protein [Akkermansiaceae bacterium]